MCALKIGIGFFRVCVWGGCVWGCGVCVGVWCVCGGGGVCGVGVCVGVCVWGGWYGAAASFRNTTSILDILCIVLISWLKDLCPPIRSCFMLKNDHVVL
jgi:hypothetical protein